MRKLFGRRPSPAMLVAIAALVFAMVGTAWAGVFSKKEKQKIRGISGNVANTQISGRVMSATIPQGDSCAIGPQTGGITAVKVETPESCDVTFPRSVANCGVGATPMHPLQDIGGQASVRPLGGAVVRTSRINETNTFRDAGLVTVFAICPA